MACRRIMVSLHIPVLMVVASINPHRLSFASALKSALTIKIQSAAIGNKHVLVKSLVTGHKTAHQLCADAAPLILWQQDRKSVV